MTELRSNPHKPGPGGTPGQDTGKAGLPRRFRGPRPLSLLLVLVLAAFGGWAIQTSGFSIPGIIAGIPDMLRVAGEMVPPETSRLAPMLWALLETFQMAFLGAALGIVGALFLSIGAVSRQGRKGPLYWLCRLVISFFRTVPDLVWAIFFVASVGLGPFAGVLTIMVDTMGFCGRFFAEAMEEVDPEPAQGLTAMGSPWLAIIFTALIPSAMPAFINAGLFSLEKAVRASVILGLVGAGGIGIELKASMDMFMYKEAFMVILLIFGLVVVVEQLSSRVRRHIFRDN